MSKRKACDDLLAKVMKKQSMPQEIHFLNTVLGFLNRRSNFLSHPGNVKQVTQLLHKHIDIAKQREIERKAGLEKKKEKKKEETNALPSAPLIVRPRKKEASKESNDIAKKTEERDDSKSEEKSEKNTTTTTTTIDVDKDDDLSGIPVGNGGTTDRYVWTQTLNEVEVKLQVPDLKSRFFNVDIRDKSVKITLKTSGETILEGDLHAPVLKTDCTWTMDKERGMKTKSMTLVLTKKEGMTWWNRVFIGDPEIDTQKIRPENSKLHDLDDETRQTVEKMMFDQRQKMMGRKTSKEIEQEKILAQFKAQHPEMDFSKVQFG